MLIMRTEIGHILLSVKILYIFIITNFSAEWNSFFIKYLEKNGVFIVIFAKKEDRNLCPPCSYPWYSSMRTLSISTCVRGLSCVSLLGS